MISLHDVTVEYGKDATKVCALQQVSLEIQAGEAVAVMGKSGSGKTTLLKVIGSLLPPTKGKVQVAGENLYAKKEAEQCCFRRRQLGFVYQAYDLIPELTVRENILLPALLDGRQPEHDYLLALCDKMEINGKMSRLPGELSGGEQQRTAIVRAMINRPKLLLCDEPTGNLDQQTGETIINAILQLQKDYGTTVLVVTHDPEIAAKTDRIIKIHDGRLVSP